MILHTYRNTIQIIPIELGLQRWYGELLNLQLGDQISKSVGKQCREQTMGHMYKFISGKNLVLKVSGHAHDFHLSWLSCFLWER